MKGACDVCEAADVELSRAWVTGIETFACSKCRGVEEDEPPFFECPDCGKDIADSGHPHTCAVNPS